MTKTWCWREETRFLITKLWWDEWTFLMLTRHDQNICVAQHTEQSAYRHWYLNAPSQCRNPIGVWATTWISLVTADRKLTVKTWLQNCGLPFIGWLDVTSGHWLYVTWRLTTQSVLANNKGRSKALSAYNASIVFRTPVVKKFLLQAVL